jgi:hypothetical protein
MAPRHANSFASVVTALANALLPHVIPLFAVPRGKRPALAGTALLVEGTDGLFAISARHVLDQAMPPGVLYFYDKTRALRKLSGTMIRTAPLPGSSGPDTHDVAVLRLPPDTPKVFLETLKYPAPMRAVLPFRSNRADHQYLVTGFPSSRSRADPSSRHLKSQPQGFRLVSASHESYARLGLSPERHIVMPLNVEAMEFPDGTKGRIPDPHGMSGSPVWLLYDERLPNDTEFTPVVGIAIEYHKTERLLVATDIGVALDLISVGAA